MQKSCRVDEDVIVVVRIDRGKCDAVHPASCFCQLEEHGSVVVPLKDNRACVGSDLRIVRVRRSDGRTVSKEAPQPGRHAAVEDREPVTIEQSHGCASETDVERHRVCRHAAAATERVDRAKLAVVCEAVLVKADERDVQLVVRPRQHKRPFVYEHRAAPACVA